jgi:acetamidase/formamidase
MIVKKPTIVVEPGERFVIETEDAYNGRIRAASQLPTPEALPELANFELNPLGGPVHVKGAQRGNVLAVDVLDIIPDEQGVTCFVPGEGPLADSASWPECRGPFTHVIKHVPGPSGSMSNGKGILSPSVSWDLKPLIGTIGVAPEKPILQGSHSLLGQGPWGGNFDCRDICKGSKLYLPVYNEGALLYAGDVHATQGDGEFYGEADETRAEIVLSCNIIENKRIPFPRIEKDTSIIQLNCGKPLENTITQAFLWLMEWLVTDYGMERKEAYMHMCVNPDLRINVYQMISIGRLQYTAGVEFPKKYLR